MKGQTVDIIKENSFELNCFKLNTFIFALLSQNATTVPLQNSDMQITKGKESASRNGCPVAGLQPQCTSCESDYLKQREERKGSRSKLKIHTKTQNAKHHIAIHSCTEKRLMNRVLFHLPPLTVNVHLS